MHEDEKASHTAICDDHKNEEKELWAINCFSRVQKVS